MTSRRDVFWQVEEEKRSGNWAAALAPRDEWDAFDPNLISEGLFAAANIFSSLKLIYIFTVNPHLGPLQISLGRMVSAGLLHAGHTSSASSSIRVHAKPNGCT